MQILIGCAKDMRGSDDGNYGIMTEPRFAGEAMHNALQMAGYDEAELADMLHCNADIARQNRLRYMHFAGEGPRLQAVWHIRAWFISILMRRALRPKFRLMHRSICG